MPRAYVGPPLPDEPEEIFEDDDVTPLFQRGHYMLQGGTCLRDYYPADFANYVTDLLLDSELTKKELL